MSTSISIRFGLNGHQTEQHVPIRMTVAELLRDRLALTGTKVSCELQVCGVCTVVVDDKPMSACSMLACDLDGTDVQTIEGLANGNTLHPLQEAFCDENAFQCGFCTPGFIMMSVALLQVHPRPTPEQVRDWLDGNLCRCTGYQAIERAVAVAVRRLESGGDDD